MAAKKANKTVKETKEKKVKKDSKDRKFDQKRDRSISYKNYEYLAYFMNDRAKVYSKKQTGLPAKLQRKLTREVKRARHLGLLPYKASI